jgi:hypothetical protein
LSTRNDLGEEIIGNKYDLDVGKIPKAISDLTEFEIKVVSMILPHVSVVYTK